jgi:trk system potassium uptake protein TrkA
VQFIIVGCGRVGSELAMALHHKRHQVTVIDHVGSSFEHLPPDYRGRTVEAEALHEHVLERAGVEQADGLAAVTNLDAVNAVVAYVARQVYGVPNVVARNYDPRFLPLHEAFGLQAISSTAWGAQRIEEMLTAPALRSVFSAGNGEIEVFEVLVPEPAAGLTLGEFLSGVSCVAVSHTHAGNATLPDAARRLAAGDVVHVSASLDGVAALRRRLEKGGE